MNEDIKRIFIDTVTTYNYSDREVDNNVLHELYELTKWSATSFNCSPLRLVSVSYTHLTLPTKA